MHLLSLVEEMLDLSKVEAGKLEIGRVPTQPGILLDESLMMLRPTAEAAQVEILVDGAPSAWPILDCDPVKLKQVFVNLIGNAIKFTPAGGQVTVSGETDDVWLRVRISDTGDGMRPEEIPLVVQPFYRTNSAYDAKHQGAGLGLPFAKAVVELHGGSLAIESRLALGTTVTISLPVAPHGLDAVGIVA
jgi:signal transduction histidine kinase